LVWSDEIKFQKSEKKISSRTKLFPTYNQNHQPKKQKIRKKGIAITPHSPPNPLSKRAFFQQSSTKTKNSAFF